MRKLFTLMIGVALGFVVAHFVNATPAGRRFFSGIDRAVREFQGAVVEGYRSREAEFEQTLSHVEQAINDVKSR